MKSNDVDWLFKEITSENLKSLKLRGINWCSNVRGIYKHKHVQKDNSIYYTTGNKSKLQI